HALAQPVQLRLAGHPLPVRAEGAEAEGVILRPPDLVYLGLAVLVLAEGLMDDDEARLEQSGLSHGLEDRLPGPGGVLGGEEGVHGAAAAVAAGVLAVGQGAADDLLDLGAAAVVVVVAEALHEELDDDAVADAHGCGLRR